MTTLWSLYRKELQEQKNTYALLLIAAACVAAYGLTREGGHIVWGMGITLLPYGTVLVLPYMLRQSFVGERKAKTQFQLLALPVPRWQIVAGKVGAVLTASIAIFAVATGAFQVANRKVAELDIVHGAMIDGIDIWSLGGIGFLAFLLLFMGLVCILEGLGQVVRRHRGLGAIGAFFVFFWLYIQASGWVVGGMGDWGNYPVVWQATAEVQKTEIDIGWLLYTGLYGMAMLVLGMWLYNRYAEVD